MVIPTITTNYKLNLVELTSERFVIHPTTAYIPLHNIYNSIVHHQSHMYVFSFPTSFENQDPFQCGSVLESLLQQGFQPFLAPKTCVSSIAVPRIRPSTSCRRPLKPAKKSPTPIAAVGTLRVEGLLATK